MKEKGTPARVVRWTIQDAHPEAVDKLREKLAQVLDPEIGLNIIQLGMVRNVEIKDEKYKITMILTTPFCPYAPVLLEAARAKAQEALDLPVEIELGTESWDFSMMEDPEALNWGLYT